MSTGKSIAQAGHAYVGAAVSSIRETPETLSSYHSGMPDSPGTKICMQGSLGRILKAVDKCVHHSIPHFLVVDSGCPDFFGGKPTVTAMGFGPTTRAQADKITRNLRIT